MNNKLTQFMTPVITVCVPTYNHARYIEESIESIIIQGIDNLNIIIADDASTDGTGEICQILKKKYNTKIILIQHTKNIGVLQNVESIYENIPENTKYLSWFSGDDIMLPGKLLEQIKFFENHVDYVMCYHDTLVKDDEHNTQFRYNDPFCGQKPYEGEIAEKLIENGCFISALSILLRWDKLKHIRHNKDLSIYNDWAYIIEIAIHGKIGYLNKVLAIYRRHPGNITRTKQDNLGILNILYFINKKYGYNNAVNKGLTLQYLTFGIQYLLKFDLSNFFKNYSKAWSISLKSPRLLLNFLFWHIHMIYHRVCLFLKTGRMFRF